MPAHNLAVEAPSAVRAEGQAEWSAVALAYFRAHAISPAVAAASGVTEAAGTLCYPCVAEDGSRFERARALRGGRTHQPRGIPLAPWWPGGNPGRAVAAVVTEGESDALAALTALRASCSRALGSIGVVCVPGASFPAERLAEHLMARMVRNVWLAYDADDPGLEAARKASNALAKQGIQARSVTLPPGTDLAECLAAADDPARWLQRALLDGDAHNADQEVRESRLLRMAGAMKRVGFSSDAISEALKAENTASQPVLEANVLDGLLSAVRGWTDQAPLWLTDPVTFVVEDERLNHDERYLLLLLAQRLRSDGTKQIGTRTLARQSRLRGERVLAAKDGLVKRQRVEWTCASSFQPGTFRVLPWSPCAHGATQSVPDAGTEVPQAAKDQQTASSPHRSSSYVPPPGSPQDTE